MGTRSNIAYQRPNGQVIMTYCHYDGYPEYNGLLINKHYNNQSKAEELANQGYLSSLQPTIEESLEGRANIEPPQIYHSLHSYINDINFDIEWIYLFKNNQWYVAEHKVSYLTELSVGITENDFQPLWSVIAKLEKKSA